MPVPDVDAGVLEHEVVPELDKLGDPPVRPWLPVLVA